MTAEGLRIVSEPTFLGMNSVETVAAAAIMAAAIAIWGIISQRFISCRQATLTYILSSQADRDLIDAKADFIKAAKGPGGTAAYADEDKEGDPTTLKIGTLLNHYEATAIGVQSGIIDFELYKRWCKSSCIRHWRHAAPFVQALRHRLDNDALFHEFEDMVDKLKGKKNMPRRRYWLSKIF